MATPADALQLVAISYGGGFVGTFVLWAIFRRKIERWANRLCEKPPTALDTAIAKTTELGFSGKVPSDPTMQAVVRRVRTIEIVTHERQRVC